MCGVVAALDATEEQMEAAMKRLSHRGVRHRIVYGLKGAVGHVRLPIVGLGEEHDQPKWCGQNLIGFVGEILDFKEDDPGRESDVELAHNLFYSFGPIGFSQRDGFWGIAAVDDALGVVHAFTDYLGQKPMYYREDKRAVASEIDALLPFGRVTLDQVYLSACMKWGYCPDLMRTPYNEIKHVLPGEHVVLGMSRPWKAIVDPIKPVSGVDKIWEEIEKAVERRVLSSDVPVACLLSGGVDSAIVYTLAKRYGDVKTYTAVTREDQGSYWDAMRVMQGSVKAFSADVITPPIAVSTPRKIYYDQINAYDALCMYQEPIDLGSLRPQYALAVAIDESVCLTGDGADELFGGYERSTRYDSQYSDVFQELPAWHLPRLDRAMMRNRVEVRSPFLARRVVQLALDLPHQTRIDKCFLRALSSALLPPTVSGKPKEALRTAEINRDREAYSRQLVGMFVERFQRMEQGL